MRCVSVSDMCCIQTKVLKASSIVNLHCTSIIVIIRIIKDVDVSYLFIWDTSCIQILCIESEFWLCDKDLSLFLSSSSNHERFHQLFFCVLQMQQYQNNIPVYLVWILHWFLIWGKSRCNLNIFFGFLMSEMELNQVQELFRQATDNCLNLKKPDVN
jgi:hypothetical protein